MTTPPITLGAVNMEAENPQSLANFYAQVTGGTPQSSGETVYMPPAGPGSFAMGTAARVGDI